MFFTGKGNIMLMIRFFTLAMLFEFSSTVTANSIRAINTYGSNSDYNQRPYTTSYKCYPGQQQVQRHVFWACQNGVMIPSGCIIPTTKQRILAGAQSTDDQYLWLCSQELGGRLTIGTVACIYNGKVVQGGEVFIKDNYAYTCTITWRNQVQVKLTGCAGDDGVQVGDGSTVTVHGTLMMCSNMPNAIVQLVPVSKQPFIEIKFKRLK